MINSYINSGVLYRKKLESYDNIRQKKMSNKISNLILSNLIFVLLSSISFLFINKYFFIKDIIFYTQIFVMLYSFLSIALFINFLNKNDKHDFKLKEILNQKIYKSQVTYKEESKATDGRLDKNSGMSIVFLSFNLVCMFFVFISHLNSTLELFFNFYYSFSAGLSFSLIIYTHYYFGLKHKIEPIFGQDKDIKVSHIQNAELEFEQNIIKIKANNEYLNKINIKLKERKLNENELIIIIFLFDYIENEKRNEILNKKSEEEKERLIDKRFKDNEQIIKDSFN